MKTAALILGIIGGIVGIIGSFIAMSIGGVASAFSVEDGSKIVILSLFGIAISITGIVGGSIAKSKPKTGGVLMLIAAIDGTMAVSAGYLVAAPLLLVGGIMAFIEGRKEARQQENKKKTKNWIWLVVGIVIFIMIIVIVGPSDGVQRQGESNNQIEEAKQMPSAGVRKDLQIGNAKWQVLRVVDHGNILESRNSFMEDKHTEGKFIEIEVIVENMDKDMLTVSDLKLLDNQNREFISMSDAYSYIPDNKELTILENINPGMSFQFVDIYELPKDANGLKLKVGDLKMFTDDYGYIYFDI